MRTGGCYCGAIRYESEGEAVLHAQCHCRPCQYFSGGGPNFFMLVPKDGFRYTSGAPAQFTKPGLEGARTRDFCPTCGVHLLTRLPGRDEVVLKVGTLDNAEDYSGPAIAIYCEEEAHFHMAAEGVKKFDTLPGAKGTGS